MPALHLLSDPGNLMGFVQIVFAMTVMMLMGRLVTGGRGGPAVHIIGGWGVLCLALTIWGMLTPVSLKIPATAFALVSLAGLLVKGDPGRRADFGQAGRVLVIAAPLLLVMADIAVSQPDALLAIVPNAAYIFDYGHFPVQPGPPVFTDVPVAPYNTELVSLLGSLAGGVFTANGPSLFTIFLHLVAGLLLAEVIAGKGRPGWGATALGLILATLLNPGFVPRVSFAGYGEAPIAIALLFAVRLGVLVLEDLAIKIAWPRTLWPLALSLAVLVNIKQQAVAVLASAALGMLVVAHRDYRMKITDIARVFGLAVLPAAVLYLGWRGYVLTHFPEGELAPVPWAQWVWRQTPAILLAMGRAASHNPVYFGAVAVMFGLLAAERRFMADTTRRVLRVGVIAFLAYNLFILLTFIGHFRAEHSYFRYNTHLSLLVVLGLTLVCRDWIARWGWRWNRAVTGGAVAIMLAAPLGAAPLLRFDRDMPQPRMRLMARHVAESLDDSGRLALVMPRDNSTVATEFEALLRYDAPRHPFLDVFSPMTSEPVIPATVAAQGYHQAFVSCTTGMGMGLPPDAGALFTWSDGVWTPTQVWPYPPAPKRTWWNWTSFIASEPLCL